LTVRGKVRGKGKREKKRKKVGLDVGGQGPFRNVSGEVREGKVFEGSMGGSLCARVELGANASPHPTGKFRERGEGKEVAEPHEKIPGQE